VRSGGSNEASTYAGRALIDAARRVDTAMPRARASVQVQTAWRSLRRQLAAIDPTYTT
jgi:hypothetical protein